MLVYFNSVLHFIIVTLSFSTEAIEKHSISNSKYIRIKTFKNWEFCFVFVLWICGFIYFGQNAGHHGLTDLGYCCLVTVYVYNLKPVFSWLWQQWGLKPKIFSCIFFLMIFLDQCRVKVQISTPLCRLRNFICRRWGLLTSMPELY